MTQCLIFVNTRLNKRHTYIEYNATGPAQPPGLAILLEKAIKLNKAIQNSFIKLFICSFSQKY